MEEASGKCREKGQFILSKNLEAGFDED